MVDLERRWRGIVLRFERLRDGGVAFCEGHGGADELCDGCRKARSVVFMGAVLLLV